MTKMGVDQALSVAFRNGTKSSRGDVSERSRYGNIKDATLYRVFIGNSKIGGEYS